LIAPAAGDILNIDMAGGKIPAATTAGTDTTTVKFVG
jgi:hypothetical protein